MTARDTIMVVDDDRNVLWLFDELLSAHYNVVTAGTGEEAVELLDDDIGMVMLDLRLPRMNGFDALKRIKGKGYDGPVIIMTGHGDVKTAVEAMKLGAHDYVTKPFNTEELQLVIEGALRFSRLSREVSQLRSEIQRKSHFRNIVAISPPMLEVLSMIERVAPTNVSVLLQGESGTGKELLARAVHNASSRKDRPFVPLNCAAVPESLLESELFGYEEGAFTGARKGKPGKFEMADHGTLFLDEVGDLPLSMQAKLLRAVEEKIVERLGSVSRTPVDVRIVSATNRDLARDVQDHRFREDLYFRLAALPIRVPPLRDRKEDIVELTRHFLRDFCAELGREVPSLTDGAMSALVSYGWPGNARQLRNVIQQCCLMCEEPTIHKKDLWGISFSGFGTLEEPPSCEQPSVSRDESPSLASHRKETDEEKRRIIQDALSRSGGNRTKAARILGISRRWLQVEIKKWHL